MCDVLKCESLTKICDILAFYETVKQVIYDGTNADLLLKYVAEYKGNVINDYMHLLKIHLDNDKTNNDQNFQIICDILTKHNKCDLTKCLSCIRNSRNREIEENTQEIKPQLIFYVDLLDNIHCHLLHSYQTGFRIISQKEESKQNNININNDETNKDNSQLSYDDHKLKDLQQYLSNKRKTLKNIGTNRIKKSKFVINAINNITEEKVNHNDEKNDDKHHLNYSFGIRCYFWDYYKNNENKDIIYNNGDKYSDWYIAQKYNNLKQEITENKTCVLNIEAYNNAYQKAVNFMNCDVIKQIQSENVNNSWCQLRYTD
eukprot:10178_1